jgi:hypothetical protein
VKVRLIPFAPEHYLQVFDRTLQFATPVGLPDPVKTACSLAEDGPAATGITEAGDVAGCAGLVMPWAGTASGWAMLDRACLGWPLRDRAAFFRLIRQQLDAWIDEHKLARIEASVQPDFPLAHRFIEALGFAKESDMPRYQNGRTFSKYVRLP